MQSASQIFIFKREATNFKAAISDRDEALTKQTKVTLVLDSPSPMFYS